MIKRLLIASCLLCAASVLALDIVKDGKAVAEIVLAKDANRSQQLAAEDLQSFFEQISGAKVAINDKPGGNVKNVIYVGENEYTRKLGFELDAVKNGGYRLLVSGDYAIVAGRDRLGKINNLRKRDPQSTKEWREFAGEAFDVPSAAMAPKDEQCALGIFKNDDTGTWYAGSELLEQLGVRFYHPYENGTVVPQAKDLALEKQDLTRIPRALYREYYAHHTRHCPDFQKWMHRNRFGASTLIYDNHTTVEILSDDIRAEYPQVLARDKDGIPYDGRGHGVPKLTDPKFRELSIKFLCAVFSFNPDIAAMALGMPDGMGNIDYKDSIAFRVAEKEHRSRFSDYVWDYWSWAAAELKKTHPDKYLTCLAYAGYSAPPSDPWVVPANAFITYCYSTMQLLEEHTAGPILEKRRKWIEILGNNRMRTWDYIFYGRHRPPLPMYFFELLQKDIQALDGIYLGKFIEGESDIAKKRMKYPGLMHFTIYWHGRLFWNAREDRAKVMAEYFRLYFGPAEKEMKEFYEFAEYHFTRPDPARRLNAKLLQEHNEKYFEMLARARRKAGKDTVYDKRIAEIETEMMPVKTMHESLLRRGEEIKIA
ncbi:MAG: DUF4838 domain-containing protein, partial [Kiritimatiellia bacterium]